MKRLYPAIVLGLALALLMGAASPAGSAVAQQAATPTACANRYVVKAGDWVRQIARQFNVDWREIVRINNLARPDLIYPGQVLCLPPTPTATATRPTSTPPPTATGPTPTRTSTALPSATARPPYTGIPTFRIVSVVRDQSVTIETANFPAGLRFDVRMGAMGTRGVGGTLVTTQDSGQGGRFQATYTIPAGLRGAYQIAIRLEHLSTGYYAFNWFYNNNAP